MTNVTLTDDQLTKALLAAADDFEVAEWEGVPTAPASQAWWQRRSYQLGGLVAASVAGVVLLGSIASHTQRSTADRAAESGAKVPPVTSYDGDMSGGGTTGGTTGGVVLSGTHPLGSYAARPPHATAGVAGGTTDQSGTSGTAAPSSPSRIVQTGSIALVVDDDKVKATMDQLSAIARGAGGSVTSSALQSAGDNPSANVTIRVPVGRFSAVVGQITSKGFGAKVISADTSGKDVTAEYADTQAQIASLKAARDRYLTILNAAKTVGEILSVQQRVDSVQGQIDRLEGARRLLANQSDLGTIEVSVNQKTTQVLVKAERSGWSKAWHDAGHGFTSGIQSIVAHSGRALLLLLVLVAGVVVLRGGWRVARRRLI